MSHKNDFSWFSCITSNLDDDNVFRVDTDKLTKTIEKNGVNTLDRNGHNVLKIVYLHSYNIMEHMEIIVEYGYNIEKFCQTIQEIFSEVVDIDMPHLLLLFLKRDYQCFLMRNMYKYKKYYKCSTKKCKVYCKRKYIKLTDYLKKSVIKCPNLIYPEKIKDVIMLLENHEKRHFTLFEIMFEYNNKKQRID